MTQKKRTSKKSPPKTNPWITGGVIAVIGIGGVALIGATPPESPQTELAASVTKSTVTTAKQKAAKAAKATPGQKAAQAAYDAGFRGSDLVTMIAIADQESDFRSVDNAGLNKNGSVDYGVWQINKRAHPSLFKKYSWKSVTDNAKMAKIVFDEKGPNGKRKGFTPWSSYNSGAYKQNLSTARTLAAGVKK